MYYNTIIAISFVLFYFQVSVLVYAWLLPSLECTITPSSPSHLSSFIFRYQFLVYAWSLPSLECTITPSSPSHLSSFIFRYRFWYMPGRYLRWNVLQHHHRHLIVLHIPLNEESSLSSFIFRYRFWYMPGRYLRWNVL